METLPHTDQPRTLDEQREAYKRRRFLAMPLAGTIVWTLVGVAGAILPPLQAVWVLFIGTGCIAYLGMFLSKFTGENFLDKTRPKNAFDGLFMHTVVMALLVYTIAIPFFIIEPASLPLTVGILTGIMWVPLSWTIQHWVGLFHGFVRTFLIVAVWFLFPDQRFVIIPAVIVIVYLLTIGVLEKRWRAINKG